MIEPPKTKKEARKYKYGQWAADLKGRSYVEDRCAYEVYAENLHSYQCSRKNGYGPDLLYCKQHARIVRGES